MSSRNQKINHIQEKDEDWIDHGNSISLIAPKDFDFNECLKFLDRNHNECLHSVANGKLCKLVEFDQNLILLQLSYQENLIVVDFLNCKPKKVFRSAVAHYIRDWFDLETNLKPFYRIAKQDRILKKLVNHHKGLRLIGIPDLFEALSWAIIGQQINLDFAYTLKKRLVESYGQKLEYNGNSYYLFPSTRIISQTRVSDLMKLQFTGKKSEHIIELSKSVSEDTVSKVDLIKERDPGAIRNILLTIRGVGPWTANYVMMKCLRIPSAFPIEDVGLHNAIKQQLNLSHKPNIDEIRKLSANWKNWEAYATFYLWRSLI